MWVVVGFGRNFIFHFMSNICDTLVYSSFIARSTRHISSLTFSGATFFWCPFERKCVLIWCNFYWLLCLVWRFPASRGWRMGLRGGTITYRVFRFPFRVSGTMDFIRGINVHINKSLMCEIQAGTNFPLLDIWWNVCPKLTRMQSRVFLRIMFFQPEKANSTPNILFSFMHDLNFPMSISANDRLRTVPSSRFNYTVSTWLTLTKHQTRKECSFLKITPVIREDGNYCC